jgi:hypothetical protein
VFPCHDQAALVGAGQCSPITRRAFDRIWRCRKDGLCTLRSQVLLSFARLPVLRGRNPGGTPGLLACGSQIFCLVPSAQRARRGCRLDCLTSQAARALFASGLPRGSAALYYHYNTDITPRSTDSRHPGARGNADPARREVRRCSPWLRISDAWPVRCPAGPWCLSWRHGRSGLDPAPLGTRGALACPARSRRP